MNAYLWSLFALVLALFGQAIAAGQAFDIATRKGGRHRAAAFALFVASLVLTLQHGYAFELALRTGLFDFRQSILAALSGICAALGLYGLRRNA